MSADPEILSRKLTPEDKYIVVCSDGVFEFLSNEEVMEIVTSHKDPFEAAAELVELSYVPMMNLKELPFLASRCVE